MGIFSSKNDNDNAEYKAGYDHGRGSEDPLSYAAYHLVGSAVCSKEYNDGYKAGSNDAAEHGKKD